LILTRAAASKARGPACSIGKGVVNATQASGARFVVSEFA
jgi:hypothetical protein